MATAERAIEIGTFHVEVPEQELDDLPRRTPATRAAWQEPELFTTELRAAFRPLRDERRSS